MVLGQSSATAAVMAITAGSAVQDVPYEKLKKRLVADGQVLELPDLAAKTRLQLTNLEGVVVDDTAAKLTGQWQASTSISPFLGSGYQHDGKAGDGRATATYLLKLPKAGRYRVRLLYPANPSRATNVPVVIRLGEKKIEKTLNQRKPPVWWGPFEAKGSITLSLSNQATNEHVVIDAAQATPVE